MELEQNIKQATHIQICNQAQKDMSKKFGWFTMMFLFWLPKYNKWYQERIKQLKFKLNNTKELK